MKLSMTYLELWWMKMSVTCLELWGDEGVCDISGTVGG